MQWRPYKQRLATLLATAAFLWLAQRAPLHAQTPNLSPITSPTGMGPLAMSPSQLMGTGGNSTPSTPETINITDSYVSFIDAAVPRNIFMLRVDLGYNMPQPTRAEYFLSKGGFPGSSGESRIETRINSFQELDTYGEYALTSWFSMFIQAPYRWINPQVNNNTSGTGNMQYGLKLCTWSSDSIIATLQLRVYQPAGDSNVGYTHWTIEPGLLAAMQLTSNILLEGNVRYWIPLGGTDFAGDILEYGIGLSYGKRQPAGFWYAPVLEGVGWTVLNGKSLVASSPDSYLIQNARGETILNGSLGMRFGYGNLDFYAGYSRCFTGDSWQRDTIRFEFRYIY